MTSCPQCALEKYLSLGEGLCAPCREKAQESRGYALLFANRGDVMYSSDVLAQRYLAELRYPLHLYRHRPSADRGTVEFIQGWAPGWFVGVWRACKTSVVSVVESDLRARVAISRRTSDELAAIGHLYSLGGVAAVQALLALDEGA